MKLNLKDQFCIIILIFTGLVRQTEQGLFDSFNNMFEVYDGAQCAFNIIEYGQRYLKMPMCCIYWKVQSTFNYLAEKQCENPVNLRKILAGEMIDSYLDLSRLDCSETTDDSKRCQTFWITIITLLFGQTLLLIIFLITSIILIQWYMKHRKIIQGMQKKPEGKLKNNSPKDKEKQRKNERNYWNKMFNSTTETSSLTISENIDEDDEENKEMNSETDYGHNDKFVMIFDKDYHEQLSQGTNKNDYVKLSIK